MKKINKLCDRDHWMDASEAVELGFADKILTPELVKEMRSGK